MTSYVEEDGGLLMQGVPLGLRMLYWIVVGVLVFVEVCGGQVRALVRDGGYWFLSFRRVKIFLFAVTGPHPPHDHTHQEYG